MLDAVRVGPIRKQASDVVELLTDPARCQVLLVTVPEETPVNELVETAYAIEDRAGVALGPVVVNGCVPAFAPAASVRAAADAAAVSVPDDEVRALTDAAAFRVDWHRRQQLQCARLAERLPLPQISLPFLFSTELGPTEITQLADAFAEGVAALDVPLAS
jgi:hypothetical protein